jgi:subtilase family serine protease
VRWLFIAALAVVVVLVAAAGGSAKRSTHGVMKAATQGSPAHVQRINELAQPSGSVHFGCQLTHPPACYGPDQIRAAYGVQALLDNDTSGNGRTIVIVDAYGSPRVAVDLKVFDRTWGLADPTLTVYTPFGIDPTSTANAFGWGVETDLDVQWSHVIAPKAKIALVVAKSNNDADINSALKYAVDNNLGDVISMSFGEGEKCMSATDLANQHAIFEAAEKKNITLFAASGDQGSAQPACDGSDSFFLSASTPASDPDVASVGGTNLFADGVSGAYQSETTWNETALFGPAASGGGRSILFKRPAFQAPVVRDESSREVPDVAYNAGINGGVIVRAFCPADPDVCGAGDSVFFRVGGTSAGSPQWAGLIALADQMARKRVGDVHKTLYTLGSGADKAKYFHDITTGNNTLIFLGPGTGTPVPGFDAVVGYDMATGLGTPIANALVPAIAAGS